MFPSENEINLRLSELYRQRDGIEREIADLQRFLELGRRLIDGAISSGNEVERFRSVADPQALPIQTGDVVHRPAVGPDSVRSKKAVLDLGTFDDLPQNVLDIPPAADHPPDRRILRSGPDHRSPAPFRAPSPLQSAAVPAVAFEDDPVAARRYGRAILDAALEALREAGRPLHAGEILERVVARGFILPGHDPVAALNTRLWKRSGPGGSLRRLGDAVYVLAEPPAV